MRIGVVGAGSISLRGILPHLTQEDVNDRLKVTAVCDPFPERANAAAERFGIPSAYKHYEDMLASGDVDAVTIASPIGIHYEQGKLAIENGIHVHFNKTMTTTVDEADELIRLAREHNVKLVASPGQMLRPINQRIKELIQDGAIGTLTWAVTGSAFGTYHEQESIRQGDDVLSNINPSWYFQKPGGGPLYDMTVYGLHTMTGILGPAKQVTAFSGIRIHERKFREVYYPTDIDDNTLMILDFGNSLFGFVYGVAAGSLPNTWTPMFFGTKGVISGNTLNGQQIRVKGDDNSLPHVVGIHKNIQESHVFEDIMQLVDWIREDKPSIVTAEHARHVIEIFDSAYRSAESKQAQKLRTTF